MVFSTSSLDRFFGSRISVLCVVFLFLLVLGHPFWSLANIAPIHDGSNCVARVSNTSLYLYQGRWGEFWEQIGGDKNELLSFSYFSMMSFIFGPGRIGWGVGWGLALLASMFSVSVLARTQQRRLVYQISWLIVLLFAPLIWRVGGLLDQRFDPFSVLLLIPALVCIFEARLFVAVVFSFLAVLAKGVALPLVLIIWTCAVVAGLIPFGAIMRNLPKTWKKVVIEWLLFAGASFFYFRYFFESVVSYNLMAVSTSNSTESPLWIFIKAAVSQIIAGRDAYFLTLLSSHPIVIVVLICAVIALFVHQDDAQTKRRNIFSVIFFASTYLLFSAHPIKSPVLVVWFVPAVWALVSGLDFARIPARISKNALLRNACLIASLLGLLFVNYGSSGLRMPLASQPYWIAIQNQADKVAAALKASGSKNVRVLANFLWVQGPGMSYNYDAFRVLLFERLGRDSPSLAGWEIGTGSSDWRKELGMFPADETLLFLLSTEGSDEVHHLKIARQMADEVLGAVNSACEIDLGHQEPLPIFGRMRAFVVDASLKKCR